MLNPVGLAFRYDNLLLILSYSQVRQNYGILESKALFGDFTDAAIGSTLSQMEDYQAAS